MPRACGFESHILYHSLADELIKVPLYNEAFGELTNISGNKSDFLWLRSTEVVHFLGLKICFVILFNRRKIKWSILQNKKAISLKCNAL